MSVFSFAGTLINVAGGTDWFMPGLVAGTPFTGTLTVQPSSSGGNILDAVLQLAMGGHLVNGRSIGLDPVKDFANHVATGPFSSPTAQHGGFVENAFFALGIAGSTLGTAGFTITGKGSNGSTAVCAVSGSIQTIAVIA